MEIHKFNAARGWTWIKQGYQLLMCSPILAITTALIGALAIVLSISIPMLGPLLAIMLMPVILAGYMRICRAMEENEEVELAYLFEGFKQHTAGLLSLGAFLMLGLIFASMMMAFIGGDAFTKLMETIQSSEDPQVLVDAISNTGGNVATAFMLGFAFVLLLIMAWQYAPILVFFSGIPPALALRASFVGTARNIVPYTVYSMLMQLLALVLSLLPFNVGMIFLLPLGLTSLYVSYRNIFPWLDAKEVAISVVDDTATPKVD